MRALIPPDAGKVTTQAMKMFLKSDQLTLSLERTRPTKTMEPTLQWVVETGMPSWEAIKTVRADPSSMKKPLEGQKRGKG